jgi:flagellar basal body-associated protein FliL
MNNIIEKYNTEIIIFLIGVIFISLISGITFAVFKSKNDEYVETERKSNPDFSNTDSEKYNAWMITFFVLFVLFSAFLLLIIFRKDWVKSNRPQTPKNNYEPLLPNKYDSSKETTPNDLTPLGLSGGSNYLGTIRGGGIKKKLNFEELDSPKE